MGSFRRPLGIIWGSFGDHLGPFGDHLGPFGDHLGIIWGSPDLGHLGIIWAIWGSSGDYLRVIWDHLGIIWGLFGDHLGTKMGPKWEARGSKGGSGTSLAPGTQKVPKVCNRRHKQAQGQTTRQRALPDFGTP